MQVLCSDNHQTNVRYKQISTCILAYVTIDNRGAFLYYLWCDLRHRCQSATEQCWAGGRHNESLGSRPSRSTTSKNKTCYMCPVVGGAQRSRVICHMLLIQHFLSVVGVSHKLVGNMASGGLQTFVNKVKSTAREFADSLTPVLKVKLVLNSSKCLRNFCHVSQDSKFKESGMITPEEFVAAGDYLVYHCPTWSWWVLAHNLIAYHVFSWRFGIERLSVKNIHVNTPCSSCSCTGDRWELAQLLLKIRVSLSSMEHSLLSAFLAVARAYRL